MLYLFYGDRFLTKTYIKEFIKECQKRDKDAELVNYNTDQGTKLGDFLLATPLFNSRYIINCSNLLQEKDGEYVLRELKQFILSKHLFIIYEESVENSILLKLKNGGVKVKEFKAKKEEDTKIFLFLDVYLRFDREKSFVFLHKLINKGVDATSVLNILLWQLKILAITSFSKNYKEAGVKQFVFNKAKSHSKIKNKLSFYMKVEERVRQGQISQMTSEEILEDIISLQFEKLVL